LIFKKVK